MRVAAADSNKLWYRVRITGLVGLLAGISFVSQLGTQASAAEHRVLGPKLDRVEIKTIKI